MTALSSLIDTVQCSDIFDLCAQLPDQSVDMILCDLPYGTTHLRWDMVIPFEPMWAAFKRIIKPRGAIVLTASQPFTSALVMSNPQMFRYEWIWEKSLAVGFPNAPCQPMRAHENVLIFSKSLATNGTHRKRLMHYYPQKHPGNPGAHKSRARGGLYSGYNVKHRVSTINDGLYYPRSVLHVDNPNNRSLHPTQKPVALFEYLIRTYTREGDVVFDPCVGSGTTAVAARACKRHYICGDQSAEYVAIARDRLRMPFEPRQRPQVNDMSGLPLFANVPAPEGKE